MAYSLEILTGIFDRPSRTPAIINLDNVGFFHEWISAGLLKAIDSETSADIIDTSWSYSPEGGYRVECRDGSSFMAKDRNRQVDLIWANSPVVRMQTDWIGVYREERQNYVESRAKKLSKQEANHMFRIQYRSRWGSEAAKYTYYLNGLEISSDDAKHYFDHQRLALTDRYQLATVASDDLEADTTLETVPWRVGTRTYSSYYVASMEATGRNKSRYRYTVIQDKIDLGAAARVIIGGKEIPYTEMINSLEGAIEHEKSLLKNLIKPTDEIKLLELHRWDVTVPTLAGIHKHVKNLSTDLLNLISYVENPLYKEQINAARKLIAEAAFFLQGEDDER